MTYLVRVGDLTYLMKVGYLTYLLRVGDLTYLVRVGLDLLSECVGLDLLSGGEDLTYLVRVGYVLERAFLSVSSWSSSGTPTAVSFSSDPSTSSEWARYNLTTQSISQIDRQQYKVSAR